MQISKDDEATKSSLQTITRIRLVRAELKALYKKKKNYIYIYVYIYIHEI